jgi:hypothetical protein
MPLPTASTQYNDMKGTAAVDWHSGSELHELAKSKEIDTSRYFPVGFIFSGVPPKSFTIHAVDTNLTQPDFDKISEYARAHDGELPIVEFHFTADWDEISKYMKRLEVVVIRDVKHLTSFHTIDNVHLD